MFYLQCSPAQNCFQKHWSLQKFQVDVPRSNIIAERGVKLMEELKAGCKSDKNLNLKFVATNTL